MTESDFLEKLKELKNIICVVEFGSLEQNHGLKIEAILIY